MWFPEFQRVTDSGKRLKKKKNSDFTKMNDTI